MRRGHPGGGWRGENQRHFRPRGSGTPNFRPSRPFGLLESSRYPSPGPRPYRGSRPYGPPQGRLDNAPHQEKHDRNKYRINNFPRSQERGYHNHDNRDRQMPPYNHQLRQHDKDHGSYGESNFYKNPNQCHVNNMGDIDHRHQHQITPWTVRPPFDNGRQYYDDHRSPHKTPRHYDIEDDLPDYSGHRPPASDHYTTTTSSNNNNSQYSHSVDDTVDIVRKRLQNRDKQQSSDSSFEHQSIVDEDLRVGTRHSKDDYQDVHHEQPVKKRIQKQKQNTQSNCNKMKNKIVHQLFKMDKVKIHKLMDNPSSSSKFEYAISSLITEGQNSLNRHLRSVAEKSLCSTSADFIQDDTNTIYEDTFMKQMQGVLDPQDTVLLEDIKPVVMAELSRVLQLDDYPYELMQDHGIQDDGGYDHGMQDYSTQSYGSQSQRVQEPDILPKNEPATYPYFDEEHTTEQYSQNISYDHNQSSGGSYGNVEIITGDLDKRLCTFEQPPDFKSKPLFERRPAKAIDHREERKSSDSRQSRNSIDKSSGHKGEKPIEDNSQNQTQTIPLFDPNAVLLSDDDDDPFAEFDKQYHVAVDHNFIEDSSRPSSPPLQLPPENNYNKSPTFSIPTRNIEIPIDSSSSVDIKKEIDEQLQNIAESPVKLFPSVSNISETETQADTNIKEEQSIEKENLTAASCESIDVLIAKHVTCDELGKKKENKKEEENLKSSQLTKPVLQSNTRKRSTDQKPSHRKEKRKRSSHSESQEVAKSILNMFYTNDDCKDISKVVKKPDLTDKTYSDKYVKRKDPHKKVKEKDPTVPDCPEESKKQNSSSSHSNISPKDNLTNEVSKSDTKVKLKHIDMFVEQPKKGKETHQAHRNTAAPQTVIIPDDIKPKPVIAAATSFARKLLKRHASTQITVKVRSGGCQTDNKKLPSKKTQTDPISLSISKLQATSPLERMKEIDMEIQLLLQEKFKLYNSLESNAMTVPMDTMPALSMRVFNVNTEQPDEKSIDSEDAIVDDFTSIPTEELEQIALEIADEKSSVKPSKTPGRHKKVTELARRSSSSPTIRRHQKKLKTPNISLIEQIIKDETPIEEIISLDDLEITAKPKKKHHKAAPKKKSSKKVKTSKSTVNRVTYDIKDCCIVLTRIDVSKYLKSKLKEPSLEYASRDLGVDDNVKPSFEDQSYVEVSPIRDEMHHEMQTPSMVQVVEDVVNDLQFDMLDVSEDIIIGDTCEVKADDKSMEREIVTEEIILDNSQSSMEDTAAEVVRCENECKMYDYSSNENLRRDAIIVTGNADAVLAMECIDNDFIAACVDGNVYHFSATGQLLNTLRGTNQAVTCLTIVKENFGTTVYTGSLDSRIRYYDLETGMEKGPECNVLSPIQTMDRAWDTVFVGTRTGFVLQFECKNNMLIPVSTVKFSEQSILALRAMKEGPRKVLLVAAKLENVVIKDAQTGLLLRTLQGPKMSVYALLFEDGKVYCGTSSQNIHVFDYASGSHVGSHLGGKGVVCLRARGGLVFAGSYDGCVYVYREGEPRALAQLRGAGFMLLSLAILGTKIIAGYKDRSLYIWKMPLAIVQEMIL